MYGLTDTFNYSGTDDFYIIFNPANGFPQLRSISFTLTTNPTSILGGSVTIESIDAAVPEPSTWGMMLLGFGAAGLALRRRRPRQLANATA